MGCESHWEWTVKAAAASVESNQVSWLSGVWFQGMGDVCWELWNIVSANGHDTAASWPWNWWINCAARHSTYVTQTVLTRIIHQKITSPFWCSCNEKRHVLALICTNGKNMFVSKSRKISECLLDLSRHLKLVTTSLMTQFTRIAQRPLHMIFQCKFHTLQRNVWIEIYSIECQVLI